MKRKRSFKKLHKSKLSRTSSGSDKSSDDTSIDENKKRRKPANLKNKQSKSADGKTQKRASSSSDSISLDENIRTRKPKNSKNRSPGSQERKTKKTTRISISSSGENDTGFFKSSTSDNIKNNKLEDNNKCENSCCIHEKTLKSLEFKIDTVISNYHSLSKQIGTQNSLIIDLKNSFQAQNMSQYYIMSDGEESNPNVKLPCQTKEIFDQLEEALKDKDYNSKMIRKFLRMMNKELPIVKNTSAMIKHCLSRDLALQFNLLKPNDKKK
ncbi:uncharacterized protein [Chelonus insularis]|uniref:uncharacterized protein n=1 Tax=Chelonus insularis TaxID=460826 RepID=UPI00158BE429|nr:uncharacterized protein LOC118064541 [Chelonus insularis]